MRITDHRQRLDQLRQEKDAIISQYAHRLNMLILTYEELIESHGTEDAEAMALDLCADLALQHIVTND